MSSSREPSLEDVFGEETVEELGVPEEKNSYLETDPVLNMDFSQFKDPDLDFWTTKAVNAASNLSAGFNMEESSETTMSDIEELLKDFRQNFAEYKTEKPVFVSDEVLEKVGDQTVGYLKIQDDPNMYPVTVRSFEKFKDRLDEVPVFDSGELEDSGFKDADQEEAREEYRRWLETSAQENNFILPTYTNNSGLPEQLKTSLVIGTNQFVGDPSSEEVFEFDEELDSNITEVELAEGYAVQVDLNEYSNRDMDAIIDEGALVLTADGEEVYRSEYVEGGLSKVRKEDLNELTGSYVVEVV